MNITWKNCIRISISALVTLFIIHYFDVGVAFLGVLLKAVTPILIGFIAAYILNILMTFYERHYFPKLSHKKAVYKSRRPVCITAAILTLCGIIAFISRLVIPELVSCVKFLLAEIPPAIEYLLKNKTITQNIPKEIIKTLSEINWQEYLQKLISWVTSGLGGTVNTIVTAVSSVIGGIITAFLSIIFAVYLLLDKERLTAQCKRLMKNYMRPDHKKKLVYVLHVLNDCFHRFIVGQCVEAVVLGVLCALGMSLLRLPYAAMIGTLVGFTALIPVAGAYIGAVIGAIMILTVSPIQALIFIVFLIILQQVEGNLIYPKVVGNSLGLSAIWVLAAITVGGGICGIPGMLFGVPIVATLYRLISDDAKKREQSVETN
ncbi:MAG: AI-2E family transporter [Clostridia bacterium]|nr:AI-2E family transporter [Clostridia bacterium]